jgi:hypothetical protein
MFRFTIRDLLWLTVVVALVVGWWVERGRQDALTDDRDTWKDRAKFLSEAISENGGSVEWDESSITASGPTPGKEQWLWVRNNGSQPNPSTAAQNSPKK